MNTIELPFDEMDLVPVSKLSSLQRLVVPFEQKVQLVELLCLLYQTLSKKDNMLDVRAMLDKFFPNVWPELRNDLASITMSFYSNEDKYNKYGCTKVSELVEKCRSILLNELPF